MELKQNLQLRLSQQLVMTPQLQQAIRLLQLSRVELNEEIGKELEQNPVLTAEEPVERRDREAMLRERGDDDTQRRTGDTAENERATKEVDWEKFLENRSQQQPSGGGRGGHEELPPIEQNLTRAGTLQEHLLWQLQMNDQFTDAERRFGVLVIGNLDERGYLDLAGIEREDGTRTPDLTLDDLAEEAGLDPEDAPLVLEMIQRFDPVGVAARDLRESLLVQATARGYEDHELEIISRHLHNLEKHNYQAIARDLKLPLEEIYDAAKEIQKLESRPARNFIDFDERSIGITPDVFVVRDGDRFIITDNDRGVARLAINESLIRKLLHDPAAKEFVGEKLKNAQWFIRAIEQRRKTILRVTECIVDMQRDFFEKGIGHLRPLILRDVADALGLHESTISRVTTNKYVHTPAGLFELKYFFNSSIRRVACEDIASESVKQTIKTLIEREEKTRPLSDQAIAEHLETANGIRIARRTVAKYREALGILASSQRKQVF